MRVPPLSLLYCTLLVRPLALFRVWLPLPRVGHPTAFHTLGWLDMSSVSGGVVSTLCPRFAPVFPSFFMGRFSGWRSLLGSSWTSLVLPSPSAWVDPDVRLVAVVSNAHLLFLVHGWILGVDPSILTISSTAVLSLFRTLALRVCGTITALSGDLQSGRFSVPFLYEIYFPVEGLPLFQPRLLGVLG